jgi:hypothetical protein
VSSVNYNSMRENNNSLGKITISGVTGVIVGLFVLHPAAMFIKDFQGSSPAFNWNAFQIALSFEHIPMSVYFAFLGGFVGLFYGIINERLIQKEKRLQLVEGILPICTFCNKIKNDDGTWSAVEHYMSKHSTIDVHSRICESCAKKKNYPLIKK